MTIYLLRHGETTGDVENRYGGDYDDHLTETGQRQSTELGEKLKGKGIQALYASPKIRAQETAKVVGDAIGLEPETLEEFRERNSYGILTGMVKDEAAKRYPEMVEALKNPRNTIEGAEEYYHFKTRILKALENLEGETIAVVTHGGPISCIFREVLGREAKKIEDCAIVRLESTDRGLKLVDADGVLH